MNCNDFPYPIVSVFLLKNGTDITYNVPSNVHNQDVITLSKSASTGYATLTANTDGTYGTLLVADGDTYELSNALNTKQGGQYQKVTLEYKSTSLTVDEYSDFYQQQADLRQNAYSLLIQFFDGTYGLVRCFAHGDGWLFSSKDDKGTTTNTITITNLIGIQRVTSIS